MAVRKDAEHYWLWLILFLRSQVVGLLHPEQVRHHEVVEGVKVPRLHKEDEYADQDSCQSSDVRQKVKRGVDFALERMHRQTSFYCDADPDVVVLLVWHLGQWLKPEQAFLLLERHIAKLYLNAILQEDVRNAELVRNQLADL